jgi:Flp pilus assembly protein TadD
MQKCPSKNQEPGTKNHLRSLRLVRPERKTAGIAFLAVGLACLIYLPTLRYDFVWDDKTLIQENPDLNRANPLTLFSRSFAVLPTSGHWQSNQYYRPLVSLSLWVDHRFWGLNPHGYHLTNVALNLAACLLLTWLLLRLFTSFWPARSASGPALLGGLVFALHPTHVESVAFIAGRTDIIMTIFLLIAALALIRYGRRPSWRLVVLMVLTFAAALLSKEAAILFPLIALLYLNRAPRRERPSIRRIILPGLLALVAVIYLLVRAAVLKGYVPPWEDVTVTQRTLLVLNAFGRYLVLSFFPFGHRAIYPGPSQFALLGWPTIAAIFASILFLGLAVRFRNTLINLGSAWYVLFLLPVCNWFPPGVSFLAERLLYLPIIGLIIVVTGLALRLQTNHQGTKAPRTKNQELGTKKSGPARLLAGAIALYLVAFGTDAIHRLPVWQNNLTLYRAAVREAPDSPDAHDNLGVVLRESGDLPEAVREHRQAVALKPDHGGARNNLGSALLESGDLNGALTEYREAVRLVPDFALARNNLGVALQQAGNLKDAEQEYRQALRLQPDMALAHNNLGEIMLARNRLDSALLEFRHATAAKPDYALAHYNLGLAYQRLGRMSEAEQAWRTALRIMPDFRPARDALERLGDTHKAP